MFDPVRWNVRYIGIADHDCVGGQSQRRESNNRLHDYDVRTAAETAICRTVTVRIVGCVGREKALRRCNRSAGKDLGACEEEQNECDNPPDC
jgi:hypothetical protein